MDSSPRRIGRNAQIKAARLPSVLLFLSVLAMPIASWATSIQSLIDSAGAEVEQEAGAVKTYSHLKWQKVTDAAPWLGRQGHSAVAHAGKIWIMGGTNWYPWGAPVIYFGRKGDSLSDVWASEDGKNWVKKADDAWPKRTFHTSVVFAGKMWVLGGGSVYRFFLPWSVIPALLHCNVGLTILPSACSCRFS